MSTNPESTPPKVQLEQGIDKGEQIEKFFAQLHQDFPVETNVHFWVLFHQKVRRTLEGSEKRWDNVMHQIEQGRQPTEGR